jgi:sulfur carrier protein ThiS
VNGGEIGRSALDTPVEEEDQLEILAAIAGG